MVDIGFKLLVALYGSIVTIVLWRLSTSQRRLDRMEDGWNKIVDQAKAQLDTATSATHELATKLVDERFRAMTHEINGHVQGFVLTLDSLKERLEDGDRTFENLGERDHKIELGFAASVDRLKDYIRDNTANKGDLQHHQEAVDRKFEKLGEKVEAMGKGQAVMEEAMRGVSSDFDHLGRKVEDLMKQNGPASGRGKGNA